MSGFSFYTTRTLPPLWVALLVLVVLNPFCCHLLPYFETEPQPSEGIWVEATGVCAGKSEALVEREVEIAPVLWVPVFTVPVAPAIAHCRALKRTWDGSFVHNGPPRHKLFAVFLL
jgi:hypothetical protein